MVAMGSNIQIAATTLSQNGIAAATAAAVICMSQITVRRMCFDDATLVEVLSFKYPSLLSPGGLCKISTPQ
jgi:hypothetical protein